MHERNDHDVVASMDASHGRICAEQRTLFSLIAEADRRELWQRGGARDMAHWLWMRYGISDWKARRWLAAAQALASLPLIDAAFAAGALGVDKVVELTRFATTDNEHELLPWAQRVSAGAIRSRGDREIRRRLEESREIEHSRYLRWWHEDEGRTLCLEGRFPAAAGAVVARALQRRAESIPVMPGEEGEGGIEARRADALEALASGQIASDPYPDRATIVVHAPLEALTSGEGGCEVEGGGVVHAETARRLGCSARLQVMVEDDRGQPLKLGRVSREPSAGMIRALRYRDGECRFPGCGARRFVHAHHIRWWERGGRTDLDNLILVCGFHHRLVHEHGWRVRRDAGGNVSWFSPGGMPHRPALLARRE